MKNWMCDYTYENGSYMYTKFAKDHFIDEKIARKIVSDKNYSMALETLETICDSRDLTLADFFKLINR